MYRHVPPRWSEKGRFRYAPSEGYRLLAERVSPSVCRPARDLTAADATPWLAGRLEQFFLERAEAQAAPVFLHKLTGWPRAGLIDAAVPGTRFVHVVRDGRAVANSWLQMPWWDGHLGPPHWRFGPLPPEYQEEWDRSGRSFVLLAGLAWKQLLDAAERARAALPPEQWLEVRYEDLLADPRSAVGEILSFAGLPWSDDFERGFARHAFATTRITKFQHELGQNATRSLEDSLQLHLDRYRYKPVEDIDAAGPADPPFGTHPGVLHHDS
jgi:hypothetical protein